MSKKGYLFLSIILPVFFSCAVSHTPYDPNKKYPRKALQQDYSLLRDILEKKHPSVYWYTPKDSMDIFFDQYYRAIEDSMTEQQFGWRILAPLTYKLHCGHTSFGMSKRYNRWVNNRRFASFPLFLKIWNDTMAVTVNLNRRDSIFKRGTIVTSINGLRTQQLVDTLFGYMPLDGNAITLNYIRLSGNFPYYHRNILGLHKTYDVKYLDSAGIERTATLPLFVQKRDTARKRMALTVPKRHTRHENLSNLRSLSIDTADHTAILTVNTFLKGGLRSFFRRSFRTIRQNNIPNLVLDLRNNGGGKIALSTLLTKYVTRQSFKVADSSFAVARSLGPYTRYVRGRFINNLGLRFLTHKRKDGLYHFGFWERKLYKPKKVNHFAGNLYVLTSGPTFSASALFCHDVKGQRGVTLVGEETGGGAYGNDGIMIPDITLPNTKLRVRLPLFRLVQYKHAPKDGHGIVPDIYVGTSYEAVVKGVDRKMQAVMEIIRAGVIK